MCELVDVSGQSFSPVFFFVNSEHLGSLSLLRVALFSGQVFGEQVSPEAILELL